MSKPTIIIPCAGEASRLRSGEPKAIIPVYDDEPLILRQIRILSRKFPKSEICVVVGYEAGKVCRILPKNVRVVENLLYAETNVAKSIGMAIRATATKSALIVYGDLVFSDNLPDQICVDTPSVMIDDSGIMQKDEVGVVLNKGYIENFFYNHPNKWCQVAYLKNKELTMFNEISNRPANYRMYSFEVFNEMLDMGAKLKAYYPSNLRMVEIDVNKDIAGAVKIQ